MHAIRANLSEAIEICQDWWGTLNCRVARDGGSGFWVPDTSSF
jgi:hypothetical protein